MNVLRFIPAPEIIIVLALSVGDLRSAHPLADARSARRDPKVNTSMTHLIDSRVVLAVRNLQASTKFYMDVLGFKRDFGDDSGAWSFLSRDRFKVRLGECPDERPASELGDHSYVAYVVVEGIDSLHAEVTARGGEVMSAPTTEPWGMREFGIRTPDGHRIRFGESVAAHSN